jgi:prolyl-tRNA editing enzyme YbaK/EbsC (Cys-tRNA(Pro) deacylase)
MSGTSIPGAIVHPNEVLAAERRSRALIDHIESSGVAFRCIEHPPCRTSVESAAARASAGAPGSIGAKALMLRAAAPICFVMAVVPGTHKLRNDAVRAVIGKFRFASTVEIAEVTGGLEPGMIPPFAAPVFPSISRLIVDERILGFPLIGFNAAHGQRSVVLAGAEYAKLVPEATVTDISEQT